MAKQLLMGNEALGLAALHAGVSFVAGYPGTPSTEVLETVAAAAVPGVHVEWSTNEKAALEVAAGAAYSGARALVTMKQVGLNVASDPLMTLAYLGVEGGLVVLVADDPGPISSQTEQDTRLFAAFAKVPCLDPSTPAEAFEMMQAAFELSERHHCPVFVRPTTRVAHACGVVEVPDSAPAARPAAGFVRDTQRWVVFPRTSFLNHTKVERRAPVLAAEFSESVLNRLILPADVVKTAAPERREEPANCPAPAGSTAPETQSAVPEGDACNNATQPDAARVSGDMQPAPGRTGIVCGGVSYLYVLEALALAGLQLPVLKIGTPYPFPEPLALEFLQAVDEVLVVEELDPVLERELLQLCGKHQLARKVHGKLEGSFGFAGEQSPELVRAALAALGLCAPAASPALPEPPALPARPPVLCAGCPHRASFYAVKRACRQARRKGIFCGDIGCYTLGNAQPLDMVDTCLCMGADITVAQGIATVEAALACAQVHDEDAASTESAVQPADRNSNTAGGPKPAACFSFIGDSTFFASGITGVINAVYNRHDIIICVLDNSTTAMTGHQPHPGTGRTMMGVDGAAQSIPAVCEALGVDSCVTVDPLDHRAALKAVKEALARTGVRVIIFKSPCIAVARPLHPPVEIAADECVDCRACVKQIGCPAIVVRADRVEIATDMCFGCQLCIQICPVGAIKAGEENE